MKSDGYKAEKDQHGKDRSKPTMKQQVRFILKARGQGSSTTELPEKAVEAVDGLVGGLARSVYNFGSVVTHIVGERQAVVNLKRYVEVVLGSVLNRDSQDLGIVIQALQRMGGLNGKAGLLADRCRVAAD